MKKCNKYSIRDIFYHKEKDIFMMVDAIDFIPRRGVLYTLKVLKETSAPEKLKLEDNWKKYYEEKLEDKCVLLHNQQNVRTMYGPQV